MRSRTQRALRAIYCQRRDFRLRTYLFETFQPMFRIINDLDDYNSLCKRALEDYKTSDFLKRYVREGKGFAATEQDSNGELGTDEEMLAVISRPKSGVKAHSIESNEWLQEVDWEEDSIDDDMVIQMLDGLLNRNKTSWKYPAVFKVKDGKHSMFPVHTAYWGRRERIRRNAQALAKGLVIDTEEDDIEMSSHNNDDVNMRFSATEGLSPLEKSHGRDYQVDSSASKLTNVNHPSNLVALDARPQIVYDTNNDKTTSAWTRAAVKRSPTTADLSGYPMHPESPDVETEANLRYYNGGKRKKRRRHYGKPYVYMARPISESKGVYDAFQLAKDLLKKSRHERNKVKDLRGLARVGERREAFLHRISRNNDLGSRLPMKSENDTNGEISK